MAENQRLLDFDELKVYFGEDYWPTPQIKITQPSLGQILEFGDARFYSIVSTLCANPTSFRLQLWEEGIDWNKVSDFDLFKRIIKNFTPDETRLLFGDLNLSWFVEMTENKGDSSFLVYVPRDENGNYVDISQFSWDKVLKICENDYFKIVEYLRYMFNIHPKVEKARGKATKLAIIEDEKRKIATEVSNQKDTDVRKSFLLPMISACLNHPGFKYKKNELKEVGIVEFMDSVKRLQTYESSTALMKGIYSGMVDTSKIKNLNEEINFMRDLNG